MPHAARFALHLGSTTSRSASPSGPSGTAPGRARRTVTALVGAGAVVALGLVAACSPLPYEPPATPSAVSAGAASTGAASWLASADGVAGGS